MPPLGGKPCGGHTAGYGRNTRPSQLEIGAQPDPVGTGRSILSQAGDGIPRYRCVHQLIRQISTPQADRERLIVRTDVKVSIDGIVSPLSELIVRLAKPAAVVQ